MLLQYIKKVYEGRFLKYYDLHYLNKAGKEKIYNMVSFQEIEKPEDLGSKLDGVVIAAFCQGKMLLLKEYRMAINREVINMCAGRLEEGESLADCAKRELYEETGLSIKRVICSLKPAYAAVSLSDAVNQLILVEAEGDIEDHSSSNEQIAACFYTREEVKKMLQTLPFSSRAQSVAWTFAMFGADGIIQAVEQQMQ